MKNDLHPINVETLSRFILSIISAQVSVESYNWLQQRVLLVNTPNKPNELPICFAAISRKIEKKIVRINNDQNVHFLSLLPVLNIEGWTLQRLCRVYLLMQIKIEDEAAYFTAIESLFVYAEMNERADIFSALPVLPYPQHWVKFCVEGIRSNLGVVQEAIMYNNCYPAVYLEEAAWNQLVLKAFFTEKNINLITGVDDRANAALAATLIDYAKERWAAKRSVNVQLWRMVSKFIDESNFSIIKELFASDDENTRQAAALACAGSGYQQAIILLDTVPRIKIEIMENKLNWGNIGG